MKEREHMPGQLDFHLPNEREAMSPHDDAWMQRRAERIAMRHQQHEEDED